MKDHHKAILKKWKAEIDTLLVYVRDVGTVYGCAHTHETNYQAGLFSTVLTAFIVESYSMLRPVSADTTNALLIQMSAQLASFRINTAFANSTQPIFALSSTSSFRADRSSVWINALWFSSLVCSLSAASLGMIVKQWLNENALDVTGTSRDVVRLRQYRFRALEKWRVGTIVAILPLLLLFASALFFGGLLILLWSLHHGIAIIATALLSALLVFAVTTTVVPVFSEDCAYRSPQSLAFYLVARAGWRFAGGPKLIPHVLWFYHRLLELLRPVGRFSRATPSQETQRFKDRVWSNLERKYLKDHKHDLDQQAIEAVHLLSPQDQFTDKTLRPCVRSLPPQHGYRCIENIKVETTHEANTSPLSSTSIGIHAALIFDIMETCADALESSAGVESSTDVESPNLTKLKSLFGGLITSLKAPQQAAGISYATWVSTPERLYRTLSRVVRRTRTDDTHIEDICRIADGLVNWQYLWSLYRFGLTRRGPDATLKLSPEDLPLLDGLLLSSKQGTRKCEPYCVPSSPSCHIH